MKTYRPENVCTEEIKFKINEDNIIEYIEFKGGCKGNLSGIAALVKGSKVDNIINKLQGITCQNGTSCPDQLVKALIKATNSEK